ncbi:MAG: acetate/propionate family kinase [bacterium]
MKFILVFNAGSTSLKYKLFSNKTSFLRLEKEGYIENLGTKTKNHKQAVRKISKEIKNYKIDYIGHRIVHGGAKYKNLTRINKDVLKEIKNLIPLAPLHNKPGLEVVEEALKLFPATKSYAMFDTGFYHSLAEETRNYALPRTIVEKLKIKRYGFHGISHEFVAEKASQILHKSLSNLNLITVHLGGGASITAIEQGIAKDTSMGFTPLEGLIMMTRSGDIDPAIPLWLMEKGKYSLAKTKEILEKESGLYGMTKQKDMLKIIKRVREGDNRAKNAYNMYCYRVKKYIGSYRAILKDVNALVFTGAVGAGDSLTRTTILKDLNIIKGIPVLTIPTDEEFMIASKINNKI